MSQLTTDLGLWCLQSETTDGSTIFIDSVSEDAITSYGNVYHSTNQAIFGNSSIYIGGTASDYIDIPTIMHKALEFRVYLTSNNKNILVASSPSLDDNYLIYNSDNEIELSFFYILINEQSHPDVLTIAPEDHNFEINQWNHLYLYAEYQIHSSWNPDGSFYNYVETKLILGINGKIYTKEGFRDSNTSLQISYPSSFYLGGLDGYVEEIRQSNNKIELDFTPLLVPYSAYIPPTVYSISGTTSIQDVLTSGITVRIYNRATGILEGTAISNESGSYSISEIPNNDLKYLICLDKNNPIIYNSLIRDRIELT